MFKYLLNHFLKTITKIVWNSELRNINKLTNRILEFHNV